MHAFNTWNTRGQISIRSVFSTNTEGKTVKRNMRQAYQSHFHWWIDELISVKINKQKTLPSNVQTRLHKQTMFNYTVPFENRVHKRNDVHFSPRSRRGRVNILIDLLHTVGYILSGSAVWLHVSHTLSDVSVLHRPVVEQRNTVTVVIN